VPVTTLRVVGALRDVTPEAWDALVGEGSPFLEWDWLATLEEAGAVGPGTGWLPQHLTVWDDDRLVGACPLYLKDHSRGEFVFDHGWASAAARARIPYYPKLLVAVPFTPAAGARFLAAPAEYARIAPLLAAVLEDVCTRHELSSVHVNFCLDDDRAALEARGWLRRTAYQYQWINEGYGTFDDYLTSLRSKRRNQARRERQALAEQGVTIETLLGEEIPDALMPIAYRLYRTTVDTNPWGQRYLNRGVFELVWQRWRRRVCLILARRQGEIIAGTFNVQKQGVLYGRYWGALQHLRHLHFNVCYYAAIEHCIRHGLQRFEPGAGGEFKHLRGFDATETQSMHWIREPRFREAVAEYLGREREHVSGEIAWFDSNTALKRDR
jgi:predicted N-acyltransferase